MTKDSARQTDACLSVPLTQLTQTGKSGLTLLSYVNIYFFCSIFQTPRADLNAALVMIMNTVAACGTLTLAQGFHSICLVFLMDRLPPRLPNL